MPLDPSIFLQGAALRVKNNEDLQKSIQDTQENSIKRDALAAEKAKAGLDLDKLFTPVAVKMSMGQQLTPEEMGVAKAYDMVNTTKLAVGPDGNYRKVNASIFGGSPNVGASLPSESSMMPPVGQMGAADNLDSLKPATKADIAGIDPVLFNSPQPPLPSNGQLAPANPGGMVNTNGMRVPVEFLGAQKAQMLFPGNPTAQQKYLDSSASKQGEADVVKDATSNGKIEFDQVLKSLSDQNEKLKEAGGTPTRERAVGPNIAGYLGSTGAGQEIGNMVADPAQDARQAMKTLRGGLARKIMAATGMSAKQMDSNAELKQFMDTIGSETSSYEARQAAYKALSQLYGNDVFKDVKDPAQSPQSKSAVSKIDNGTAAFKLKKAGYTDDQIKAYLQAKGQ